MRYPTLKSEQLDNDAGTVLVGPPRKCRSGALDRCARNRAADDKDRATPRSPYRALDNRGDAECSDPSGYRQCDRAIPLEITLRASTAGRPRVIAQLAERLRAVIGRCRAWSKLAIMEGFGPLRAHDFAGYRAAFAVLTRCATPATFSSPEFGHEYVPNSRCPPAIWGAPI